jgi:hypothetical protein
MVSDLGKAEVAHAEEGKRSSLGDAYEVPKECKNGLDTPESSDLKLDKHGLPLIPQPTDRKDDPLVCERLRRLSNPFQGQFIC